MRLVEFTASTPPEINTPTIDRWGPRAAQVAKEHGLGTRYLGSVVFSFLQHDLKPQLGH